MSNFRKMLCIESVQNIVEWAWIPWKSAHWCSYITYAPHECLHVLFIFEWNSTQNIRT